MIAAQTSMEIGTKSYYGLDSVNFAITTCQVVGSSNIGTQKEIIDYTLATSNTSGGRLYTDCTIPGGSQQSAGAVNYYIVDRKAARCINSSNYNVSGWYGTNWVKIAQSTIGK